MCRTLTVLSLLLTYTSVASPALWMWMALLTLLHSISDTRHVLILFHCWQGYSNHDAIIDIDAGPARPGAIVMTQCSGKSSLGPLQPSAMNYPSLSERVYLDVCSLVANCQVSMPAEGRIGAETRLGIDRIRYYTNFRRNLVHRTRILVTYCRSALTSWPYLLRPSSARRGHWTAWASACTR